MLEKHEKYKRFMDELEHTEMQEKREKHYQALLESRYAGATLSRDCRHGEMDIHLSDQIIEIKTWSDYKHALGQLLAYEDTVPKAMLVAFFGEQPEESLRNDIVKLFRKFHISVTYFDAYDNLQTL
jgi:hypothetical protein